MLDTLDKTSNMNTWSKPSIKSLSVEKTANAGGDGADGATQHS